MISRYLKFGMTNPFLFSAINAGQTSIIAEYFAQTVENLKKKSDINEKAAVSSQIIEKDIRIINECGYDIDRLKRMTTFRVLISSPQAYLWYTKALNFLVPSSSAVLANSQIAKKIFYDQFIFAPWYINLFDNIINNLQILIGVCLVFFT